MNIIVVGPNPKDPTRNGGVAKYIEYFKQIPFVDKTEADQVVFKGTDVIFLSRIGLKTLGRLLATLWISVQLMFKDKEGCFVHLNASLSKYGGLRIFFILLICKLKGIPTLTQVHGGRWSDFSENNLFTAVWCFIFRYSKSVGCFAGPQYKELEQLDFLNGKLSKLVNFVPPLNCLSEKSDKINFIFLGRLIREKGVFDIIDAVNVLNSESNLQFSVDIVGSGPELNGLSKLDIENIQVLGRKTGFELESILKRSNVLLLPSYYPEGFPLVFLEAGLHSLAAVVTENSAIIEYFENETEYLAVKPNAPIELASIMRDFILNNVSASQMGSNLNVKVINEFSTNSKAVLDQFMSIYQVHQSN